MSMRIWILLFLAGTLAFAAGCATTSHWHRECDWCGKWYDNSEAHRLKPMTEEQWLRKYPRSQVITDKEGHDFCSLRCKNSYLASKGIKEQRTRIIYGE